jgi:hypothetical protein
MAMGETSEKPFRILNPQRAESAHKQNSKRKAAETARDYD